MCFARENDPKSAHDVFQQLCEENTAWFLQQRPESSPSCARQADEVPSAEALTMFHSRTVPKLSLFQLGCALRRMVKCTDEALLVALVLMCRYCEATETVPTAHLMHRLYVASLQVGIKAHSDRYMRNDAFARFAGVTHQELNRLEVELLHGLRWKAQVTLPEIERLLLDPPGVFVLVPASPPLSAFEGDEREE